MGCSQSKDDSEVNNYKRRNTLVVKPNVHIAIGEGIQDCDSNGTKIVFIFGGPGSGKGTIVNNLVEMFDFKFICGEDLILENLSATLLKGAKDIGTTATNQLSKLVAEDSSMLTLHWVLELIETEVLKYPGETVVVDMVPNLKFLLRVPTFVKECQEEMVAFEEKHPIAFAINLTLDQEHLISNINQTHACTKAPGSNNNQGEAKPEGKGGTSDEMDTSRTTRRFNIYLNSVKEFLGYFDSASRMLTVDTSGGCVEAVWEGVRNYVQDVGLGKPCKGLEQILLVKLAACDFEDVDRIRYPMMEVSCKDLVPDVNNSSVLKVLEKVRLHMRSYAAQWKTFLLDVTGTPLCDPRCLKEIKNKELLFLEQEIGQLDFFMHKLRRRSLRKISLKRKHEQLFKSITTGDNEALIFPKDTDTEYCHKMALCFLTTI